VHEAGATHAPRSSPEDVWRHPRPLVALTATAVLLRLLLFLGRGDYVAFDEGWYLLLGRNLWSGEGYTLSGLQHVTLSPLFPVLAGALDVVGGDIVWAGRIVAALSAGLLVVPCWFIFGRLAGRATALVACAFVALMPSLAPFVAPYWIGWDLWVGAEPLLHLLLFTGIALFLRAWESDAKGAAAMCGVSFGLAYVARPEAIVAFGLLAIAAVAAARRQLRTRAVAIVLCAAGFTLTAAPYWSYLHDALGRWAITGRGIQVTASARIDGGGSGGRASDIIEAMLWQDESTYVRRLYSLNAAGTGLANGYWGVQPNRPVGTDVADGDAGSSRESAAPETSGAPADPSAAGSPAPERPNATRDSDGEASTPRLPRYAEALGVVFPWYLWLFVVVGLGAGGSDRRRELEALVGIPLAVTSVLIARSVAIDPRTQLFLAPLAAFYAARGVLVVGAFLARRTEGRIRGELAPKVLVGALVVALLGTSLVRLGLSLAIGSPHHVVAAENATVGEAIRRTSPEDATVVSFHPAVALFADRDWRVLPVESMDRIVRYARTLPAPHLVLSVFYPPELRPAEEPHYLIVPVPPDLPESDEWRIHVANPGTVYAFGELIPLQ